MILMAIASHHCLGDFVGPGCPTSWLLPSVCYVHDGPHVVPGARDAHGAPGAHGVHGAHGVRGAQHLVTDITAQFQVFQTFEAFGPILAHSNCAPRHDALHHCHGPHPHDPRDPHGPRDPRDPRGR